MAATELQLKLFIDKKRQRVLYAEAGKQFVDFVFGFLFVPGGTVVQLLEKNKTMGCLHDLYNSIENLSETYLQPDLNKSSMLNPKFSACAAGIPFLQSENNEPAKLLNPCTRPNYSCQKFQYFAEVPKLRCPSCNEPIRCQLCRMTCVSPAAGTAAKTTNAGFVKEMVTFMVTDNLEVKPLSTKSSLTLLNQFKLTDVGALEERDVSFGIEEGMKLLKASWECKTVLTSAFLGNNNISGIKRERNST